MASISEDLTLPLGLENTLNQFDYSKTESLATANDLSTASELSEPLQTGIGSQVTLSQASKLSPQRSRLKDQETQISELKKENFGLKLRIYHLEEALNKQVGNDSQDWRLNVDLNVEIDSLKKDLKEKGDLLVKAKHAMDGMAVQHDSHVQKLNDELSQQIREEKRKLQEALAGKERELGELQDVMHRGVRERDGEIIQLKRELDDVYSELAVAKKQLQAAASQYEGAGLQAKEEVALLRKQLREEEEKNRRAERDLRNALTQKEQEVAALEGMLKDLEEELKSAREEMTDLGSEQRNVRDQLSADLNDAHTENEDLKKELENLAAKLELLEPEMAKRDVVIGKLKQALKEKAERLGDLDKELMRLSASKAADGAILQKTIDDLNNLVDQQAETERGLRDELKAYEDELLKAKMRRDPPVAHGQDSGIVHTADLTWPPGEEELRDKLRDMERGVKQRDEQIDALKDAIRYKDSSLKDLEANLNHMRDDKGRSDQRARESEDLANKLKGEVEGLRSRLTERGRSKSPQAAASSQTPPLLGRGDHTLADLEALLAELRKVLSQLGNQRPPPAGERHGETTNYFNVAAAPSEQYNDLMERVLRLLSQEREPRVIHPSPVHVSVSLPSSLPGSTTNITMPVTPETSPPQVRRVVNESAQTAPLPLQSAVTADEERMAQLSKENKKLRSALKEMRAKEGALEQEHTALQRSLEETMRDQAALTEENAMLADQVTSLEGDLTSLASSHHQLETERGQLARRLQEASHFIGQLQNEIAALKDALERAAAPPHRTEVGVGSFTLSEQEEDDDHDMSSIYQHLKELETQNRDLKRKISTEDRFAEKSKLDQQADIRALHSKLLEAQLEIDQLRRSHTPDSRPVTPFQAPPTSTNVSSVGVQTVAPKVCHRGVMATILDSQDGRGEDVPFGNVPVGMAQKSSKATQCMPTTPQATPPQSKRGVQYVMHSVSNSLKDTPSYTSSSESLPLETHPSDRRPRPSEDADDLRTMDDQYKQSLLLNRLAQEKVLEELGDPLREGPSFTERGTSPLNRSRIPQKQSPGSGRELDNLRDENGLLQSQLADRQQQVERLSDELCAAQSGADTLEEELEQLRRERDDTSQQLHGLKDQMSGLVTEREQLEGQLGERDRDIAALQKERNRLMKKYKRLKVEKEASELGRTRLNEGVQAGPSVLEMTERIRDLEQDLLNLAEQLKSSNRARSSLLSELDLKEREQEQLVLQIAALKKELDVMHSANKIVSPSVDGPQLVDRGISPAVSLPSDFYHVMNEVNDLKDKLQSSIHSNQELSEHLRHRLNQDSRPISEVRMETLKDGPKDSLSDTSCSTAALSVDVESSSHPQTVSMATSTQYTNKVSRKSSDKDPSSNEKGFTHGSPDAPGSKIPPLSFIHPTAFSTPFSHQMLNCDEPSILSNLPTSTAGRHPKGHHSYHGDGRHGNHGLSHQSRPAAGSSSKATQYNEPRDQGTQLSSLEPKGGSPHGVETQYNEPRDQGTQLSGSSHKSTQMSPIATSQATPMATSQVSPMATSQVTPMATSQVSPMATSQVTPMATSQISPGLFSSMVNGRQDSFVEKMEQGMSAPTWTHHHLSPTGGKQGWTRKVSPAKQTRHYDSDDSTSTCSSTPMRGGLPSNHLLGTRRRQRGDLPLPISGPHSHKVTPLLSGLALYRNTSTQTVHTGSISQEGSDVAMVTDPPVGTIDAVIQTVQEAKMKVTDLLAGADLKVRDKTMLESLLQLLKDQEKELEDGRRLLWQHKSRLLCDASSQTTSRSLSHGSLDSNVEDLSDLYKQLLDTRGDILSSRDKLKKFHSTRTQTANSK